VVAPINSTSINHVVNYAFFYTELIFLNRIAYSQLHFRKQPWRKKWCFSNRL